MSRKTLLAVLTALIAVLSVPATASAVNIAVGMGDQASSMFDSPNFQALRMRKVRYFIRWNAIDRGGELALADAFVNKARANNARVLMHVSSNTLIRKQGRLPSLRQYRQKVGALVRRYRAMGVIDWGSWNEANHDTQPTWNNPRRAAQFFLAMRSMCRGCTIVALDVLDQRGVENYIRRWFRALRPSQRRLARIVGMHNYSDTNRYRATGTRKIIRTTRRYNRRTKFWMTETGGVAKFGRSFPCNPSSPGRAERRQARAIDYMFGLARRFRSYVQRLYIYNYFGTNCGPNVRFDAGIVRPDGTARPAYNRVRRHLRNFKR